MTDKEKREVKDGVISVFNRFNILDHTATIGGLRDDILRYINSLQEEPVSNNYSALLPCIYNRTLEERVKYCKYCSAACEGRVKEPVSEDLKTLTYNYLRSYSKPETNVEYLTFASCVANWQKEKDNQYFAKKTIETLDEVFEDGRDNMKQQMIAKACKYLQDHREEVETEDNGISGWISDEFIEDFENYMKG